MFNYFKMKKNEWKVKAALYGAIATVIDEQEEFWDLLTRLYVALKDVSAENLQHELVNKLAELIHGEE